MRARTLIALCLVAAASMATHGQTGASTAPDEAAIRDVVRKYVQARERADEAAVRALFTADADQLTSSGEWRKGRDNVVRGSLASSQANSGTRTIAIDAVRFPAAGVAIADGAYTIAGGAQAQSRNMRTSFVLVRDGGEWRITAIRNMLPAAPIR
jgi:uncharacterized protein (TIGR02246 family)